MEVVAPQAPQRARLLDAMVDVVADKGYAAATVADAVRAARVSRGTFYALFASKEACFIEAYRRGVDAMVARIERAVHEEPGDWLARLRAGLRCYLESLAAEPRIARMWLLELHLAGPVAQAERDVTLRRFADRYRRSFEAALAERDELRMPSDEALFVLAAGVDQLVCAHVREGDPERLADLTESLLTCAVAQLEGTASTQRGDP
jgi:AcrR family transcriptional regulator